MRYVPNLNEFRYADTPNPMLYDPSDIVKKTTLLAIHWDGHILARWVFVVDVTRGGHIATILVDHPIH